MDAPNNAGLRGFRHKLASMVLDRLKDEIPGLSAHFGEDYEQAADSEAALYRQIGGSFRFLAFAFAPWRMWDLHIGNLPVDGSSLSTGYHISDRAAPLLLEKLRELAALRQVEVIHQPKAVEFQANLPPLTALPGTVDSVADVVCELCRQMAKMAASVPCPAEMKV